MKKRILVTGGSGFIGLQVCDHLDREGYTVRALLQRRPNRKTYPVGEIVFGSLPYDVPLRALEGIDAIVHCATATTADPAENRAINVRGIKHLLVLAQKTGIKKIIFLSTQAAVSQQNDSPYAITKRECESLLKESGLPYAILRPGLVYGPPPNALFGRMCATVAKLPILPLLGGGQAIVQPIHVADLVRAIEQAIETTSHEEHNLGDPEGITLAQFLEAIGKGQKGSAPTSLSIPLAPVEWAVRLGEILHIPLPINRGNLKGLKSVEKMETRDSMRRFSLPASLRPLIERIGLAAASKQEVRTQTPLRFLLVGAGKIGLAHVLSLSHQEGIVLAGIVDRSPGALGLYKGMGFDVPTFDDFEKAILVLQPHAAIIATPPNTHLPLAEIALRHQVALLIEKPSTASPKDHALLERLARAHPQVPIAIGYQAAQLPHLKKVRELLDSGKWGSIVRVEGRCLQSHIMDASHARWDQDRAVSGGGVLINFACHLLSMMDTLFGPPASFEGHLYSIHSSQVEDTAELEFLYESGPLRGKRVPIRTSWSEPGYFQAFYEIRIETDQGLALISNTRASFELKNGEEKILLTESQFDLGFNPAPDMSGSGFVTEHQALAQAIQHKKTDTLFGLPQAAHVEGLIWKIYESLPLEKFNHGGAP